MGVEDAHGVGATPARPGVDRPLEAGVPVIREQTPATEEFVVAAQPAVVRERVVVQQVPVAQPPVAVSQARTIATRRIDLASVLAVVTAIALGVVGAVAMARAGLDGPLSEPVVQVAGFSHTAILGLIELGMALILLAVGLSRDRGAVLFVSILFGAAALVAAIEPSVGGDGLAIESSWAVLLVVVFGVIALTAAVVPAIWRTQERVHRA